MPWMVQGAVDRAMNKADEVSVRSVSSSVKGLYSCPANPLGLLQGLD